VEPPHLRSIYYTLTTRSQRIKHQKTKETSAPEREADTSEKTGEGCIPQAGRCFPDLSAPHRHRTPTSMVTISFIIVDHLACQDANSLQHATTSMHCCVCDGTMWGSEAPGSTSYVHNAHAMEEGSAGRLGR